MSITLASLAVLAGRLLVAMLFLHESYTQLTHFQAAGKYMERFGVSHLLLPPVLALQFGGGVLIVLGIATRPAALLLAWFCVAAALLFHANLADTNQLLHFEKNLAIAGGLLVLSVHGPGRYAVLRDRRFAWKPRAFAGRVLPHPPDFP